MHPFKSGRLSVFLFMILLLSLTSCMTQIRVSPKDAPDHADNFPPGRSFAIDGLYKDAWGNQFRIEKQRIFDVSTFYPQIHLYDVKKLDDGRYEGMYYFGKPPYPSQVTIISENQVLIRSEVNDIVLTVIRLDDAKGFRRELNILKQVALMPRIEVLGVKCHPESMRPGDAFRFVMEYKVIEDPQNAGAPILFHYSIEKDGRSLFMSRPVEIAVESGMDKQRRVDLKAARDEGAYQIVGHLVCGALTASDTAFFKIDAQAPLPDTRSTEERLVGSYVSVMGGNPIGILHLSLENGVLKGRLEMKAETARYWDYTVQAIEVRGDVLWMSVLMKAKITDMWAIMEDEVTINEDFDHMAVRSKSMKGNAVPIGSVYNSTLNRVVK